MGVGVVSEWWIISASLVVCKEGSLTRLSAVHFCNSIGLSTSNTSSSDISTTVFSTTVQPCQQATRPAVTSVQQKTTLQHPFPANSRHFPQGRRGILETWSNKELGLKLV